MSLIGCPSPSESQARARRSRLPTSQGPALSGSPLHEGPAERNRGDATKGPTRGLFAYFGVGPRSQIGPLSRCCRTERANRGLRTLRRAYHGEPSGDLPLQSQPPGPYLGCAGAPGARRRRDLGGAHRPVAMGRAPTTEPRSGTPAEPANRWVPEAHSKPPSHSSRFRVLIPPRGPSFAPIALSRIRLPPHTPRG